MGAYEELGKIIGESVEDDLVDEIFSKFCMGKQKVKEKDGRQFTDIGK